MSDSDIEPTGLAAGCIVDAVKKMDTVIGESLWQQVLDRDLRHSAPAEIYELHFGGITLRIKRSDIPAGAIGDKVRYLVRRFHEERIK